MNDESLRMPKSIQVSSTCLSLQVVLDKNICWNTGPAQFYEWNHFHQYIQRQTKPSIYNHFQAASDCLKGLRVTFFNLQGLDTTGKLPAPPKSLGLPGRSTDMGNKGAKTIQQGGKWGNFQCEFKHRNIKAESTSSLGKFVKKTLV